MNFSKNSKKKKVVKESYITEVHVGERYERKVDGYLSGIVIQIAKVEDDIVYIKPTDKESERFVRRVMTFTAYYYEDTLKKYEDQGLAGYWKRNFIELVNDGTFVLVN